ncbi:MAG TPA: hypothetical protein VGJ50_34590 [Streptosporangiaceae bacterium]|jgi:hypothetical protein
MTESAGLERGYRRLLAWYPQLRGPAQHGHAAPEPSRASAGPG